MDSLRKTTHRILRVAGPVAVLGLIALVYWPMRKAGLVWDDHLYLHDSAELRHGNDWLRIVFHGFRDWATYFRPLGIALFTIESRLFDVNPTPMHMVSLGLHLANVLLVGALARLLLVASHRSTGTKAFPLLAMLLFGLHPILVEPVAWISSQFELLVTFFMLLGLILNLTVRHVVLRAAGVALCFFMAACIKEAAISFPLLLFVLDWSRPIDGRRTDGPRNELIARLQRQWPVYLALIAAGLLYLVLRWWGLGFLVNPSRHITQPLWQQLQTVCATYMAYWRLLIWPMNGLSPLHIVPQQQFAQFRLSLLALDAGALTIALSGAYLFWKRHPLGCLIAGVTVALFPVLHIIPVQFDESLYHDRYAMTAAAFACSLLPLVWIRFTKPRETSRKIVAGPSLVVAAWLFLALLNVRVTLPLWSDDVRLWQWALLESPGSIAAQRSLLGAYILSNDTAHGDPIAETLMQDPQGRACIDCMLNVAALALNEGNAERASLALREIKKDTGGASGAPEQILDYILYSGLLFELQHDRASAEEAYRAAIAFDSSNPRGYMGLAYLLARQGRFDEARKAEETALPLFAPDERARHKREFDQIVAASRASAGHGQVSQPK